MANRFQLRYLPLFEQDLTEARDYIALSLHNPAAANKLIKDTEQAILKRLTNPLIVKPYRSAKDRTHPYYCIRVRNFVVFYVVIEDVMEVRRFLYSKRDLSVLI